MHLKTDCIQGSIVSGVREPIFYSFALNSPPGHKLYEERRTKVLKKNKSVLSRIIFYLKDDNHKHFGFNNETISFTRQQIKIQKLIELNKD